MKIKGQRILFCGSGDSGTGMLAMSGTLHALESIRVYRSAFDLLQAETVLPDLQGDFCDYLRSFDAYDCISYVCINGELVVFCDAINGDAVSFCQIGEMLGEIRANYNQFCDICKS